MNVSLKKLTDALARLQSQINALGSGTGGGVQSIVAGANITVDDTDPQNPVVSATGSSGASPDALYEAILTDSPRAYYTMRHDSITGTTVADQSGNSHDATLPASAVVGASALIPTDPDGRYVLIPNATDACSIADRAGLTPPLDSDYTLCMVLFSAGGNYGADSLTNGALLAAFGAGGETSAANYSAIIPNTGATKTAFQVFWEYGSGANSAINFPIIALNATPIMLHLTKKSATKTLALYANGRIVGSLSYAQEPSGGSSTSPVLFGGGLFGHWAFFDTVLSVDRIAAHAQAAALG